MGPAGTAGPRFVRVWVDEPSVVRPGSPLPVGLDKIQWQTYEHVYWMELTEPTHENLLANLNRVLSRGFGYRLLVGATGRGTRLLLDDPEEPLPLSEMITLRNNRHVRIWWSMNPPNEPMDLLFCAHRTDGEAGTPPPGNLVFGPRNNRGSPSDDEHADSDNEESSDGHQPESSAMAAQRATKSTRKTRNTKRTPGQTLRGGTADIDEPEPDSNVAADCGHNMAAQVMPALDSGFAPSPGKQVSAPPADLGTRLLRSGRQIERRTDLKKASGQSTWTAINSSGKRNLAAITEADEANSPANAAEPARKVARGVPSIGTGIEGEPDRLHGEVNLSRQPTASHSPPNSSPPLASTPSNDLASEASEQVQVRKSAEHLLMLASDAQQPADTSATQVGTPGGSRSPSDPHTGDVLVDMPAAETGRELTQAPNSPASASGYFTPGKLRLQLLGFSSAMLAAGSTAVSAETDVGSPLRFASVLTY